MALTRKLIFALRAGFYDAEMVPKLIGLSPLSRLALARRALKSSHGPSTLTETISIVADQHFSTEDTVKPVVAYLVSTLCPSASPIPLQFRSHGFD